MIFGSVCSGIEAASVAWEPLGWRAAFLSEIDAFPRAVLTQNFPNVPLHGDFTTIQAGQYDPIDLLVGGTPCQSFSLAGLRGGLDDDRGNLALEFFRLSSRLRPRWVLWENVPGVLSSNAGRDFGSIIGALGELGYGFAYRVLDAQYFGVPQRRRRVFVVGYLGDWRCAAAVLFEPESMRRNSSPRRKAGPGVTVGTIAGTDPGSGWRFGADEAAAGHLIAHTLRAEGFDASEDGTGRGIPLVPVAFGGNNTAGPIDVATAVNAHGGPHGRLDFESETFIVQPVVPTLDANFGRLQGCSGQDANHGHGHLVVQAFRTSGNCGAWATGDRIDALTTATDPNSHVLATPGRQGVRRLTPREAERLQGFPDDWTLVQVRGKPAKDGPRYKAIGNSMAVPVVRWIGRRIAAADAIMRGRP